jgi:1-deoxy-D-xylulose-5-phosphate reductoisomerase
LAAQAAELDVRDTVLSSEDPDGLERLAARPDADVVLNAVVGAAGLRATLAALRAGKRLALANKESLITGGELVEQARREGDGELVPVDSEHSAVFQCLRGGTAEEVDEIILTASGGPFRGRHRDDLEHITVEEALRHPTWTMGPKITVDSATLMNKGLEVIEAHYLFGLGYDRIRVVVHPQSIIHGMVRFRDGAVLAHLQQPTMEAPIAFALAAPERLDDAMGVIDWAKVGELTFAEPDVEAFPCLRLAYEAGRAGGLAPAVLNAANEEAVAAFLDGRLSFLDIAKVVETVLGDVPTVPVTLSAVEVAVTTARDRAREAIAAAR